MSSLEVALQALRDASDAQLKKLYIKQKSKKPEEDAKSGESEISEEDAELLRQTLED